MKLDVQNALSDMKNLLWGGPRRRFSVFQAAKPSEQASGVC